MNNTFNYSFLIDKDFGDIKQQNHFNGLKLKIN